MIFLKAIFVWVMFIVAESLNGTIREFWLVPSLGAVRAHQIAFVTGAILMLMIATLFICWLHASHLLQLLSIGVLWLLLTVAFEIGLGRFILGYSWERIAADYNVLQGGLMPFGLVLVTLSPWIATKIRDSLLNQNQHA